MVALINAEGARWSGSSRTPAHRSARNVGGPANRPVMKADSLSRKHAWARALLLL